jgi:adenylate kinase family enzyme
LRIVVKGASGAGKTTLARHLAERLGLPWIELDALHHGPGWQPASAAELAQRLGAELDDAKGWVVDGNYDGKLNRLLVDRADLIVWLDLPLPVKLARLARRTSRRIWRAEALWNGNRETLATALVGRDSLFAWAIRTHFQHRRDWPAAFAGRSVVRLRTSAEVDAWARRTCGAAPVV